jgi:hypothetical protein
VVSWDISVNTKTARRGFDVERQTGSTCADGTVKGKMISSNFENEI